MVEATLPYLNRFVRGIVEFQRLTGCRPGEACGVRRCEIDMGGEVWLYRPDQQPMQLLKETRVPIAATKTYPKRVDYEYERAGTANVFMFCEPLAGWRQATVREQRTKVDWAREVATLLRTKYKDAKKVILVGDNLSTHTRGAFYEAFPATEAWELVERLEFRYTPKHGSWLNIAENERSALTRHCVGRRRFGTIKELGAEAAAWSKAANAKQRGVDWQFRIDDARIKLKSLYPKTSN